MKVKKNRVMQESWTLFVQQGLTLAFFLRKAIPGTTPFVRGHASHVAALKSKCRPEALGVPLYGNLEDLGVFQFLTWQSVLNAAVLISMAVARQFQCDWRPCHESGAGLESRYIH